VLATGLSPLDGVLVPTFGAFYVAMTLLFPFAAIRMLGREKETGALRLLVQLPYRVPILIVAKMAAIAGAWLVVVVPALSALAVWAMLGGHLHALETLNLIFGHLLYALLIGALALFSAAISESSATAAIITLAATIGSWVLDFTLAGQPGLLDWIARLSLTQTLRGFEQGLLSAAVVVGVAAAIAGFAALAAVWLHPGTALRRKLMWSVLCVIAVAAVVALAAQTRRSIDVTEDQRNSFPLADQRALRALRGPLVITVHLAPEDPRYADLRRNVLGKLERLLRNVSIRLSSAGQSMIASTSADRYGEIEYSYAGQSAVSRSTSHREALPIIYGLAGLPVPEPVPGDDYPGYPLVARAEAMLPWFFGVLPLLIVAAWWWSCRPPEINPQLLEDGGRS
jgi:hypothetical protein